MIKHILKSLKILAFLLCLICLTYKSSWAAPSIKFDQASYDFGKIVQGKSITHIFKFKNTGDAPLKINKVRTG